MAYGVRRDSQHQGTGDGEWDSSQEIIKREGRRRQASRCATLGPLLASFRRRQSRRKTGCLSPRTPAQITHNLCCHASRSSQHAVGKALPRPESPHYSCYINNEGITERGGNAKQQSSRL